MKHDWYIAHSAKGTTWKNHKYIRKEGKRYIYKAFGLDKKSDMIKAERNMRSLEKKYYDKNGWNYFGKNSYGDEPGKPDLDHVKKMYDYTISDDNRKTFTKALIDSEAPDLGKSIDNYAHAQSDYYNKTIAGVTEKTIEKGKKLVKKILK